jgi:hypothetical protein
MAECHAIGIGIVTSDGACGPGNPSLDDAVKCLEKAIDDAEQQASKSCPAGQKCQGTAVPVGAPTSRTVNLGDVVYCLTIVTVTLDGQCGQPGAAPPPPPGQVIEADDFREFFRKVEALPDVPANPAVPCRMYREQKGHGFYYPICKGPCPGGKTCETIVEVRGRKVRAYCKC